MYITNKNVNTVSRNKCKCINKRIANCIKCVEQTHHDIIDLDKQCDAVIFVIAYTLYMIP